MKPWYPGVKKVTVGVGPGFTQIGNRVKFLDFPSAIPVTRSLDWRLTRDTAAGAGLMVITRGQISLKLVFVQVGLAYCSLLGSTPSS